MVATELKVEVDPAEVGFDARRLSRIDRHFARYVDDGLLPGWLAVLCLAFPLHPPGRPEKTRQGELDAVALPALVVQGVYGNIFDPTHATPDAVPQALLVPAELLQVLVQSLFSPLYIAFAALFYVDMRVRREGLDLELALERAG